MIAKVSPGGFHSKKQFGGGFLSVRWTRDPDLAEPDIKRCAETGFCAYLLFIRQTKQGIMDEPVRRAVGRLAEICHRHNLKLVLDTDPTHWAEDMIQLVPETGLWCVIPVDAYASAGRFKAAVKWPAALKSNQCGLREISAAYVVGDGEPRRLDVSGIEYEWQSVHYGVDLEGAIDREYTGPLRLYVSMSSIMLLDHAHPAYLAKQLEILDWYKDVPLDGVCWDEPGKGHGLLTSFRAGKAFFDLFRETNGYDLREKLLYLDQGDGTAEAVKTRLDYFRTLSDVHYRAQFEHNQRAREIWGEEIILGTHQTWCGLPCDLAAGVMDHFRLGRVLTGAWTDGGIDYERKVMAFPLMLADSLKKELGQRDCYYNDWSYLGAAEPFRFFHRFKTLFHVNTYTHIYSEWSERLNNLRAGPAARVYEHDVPMQDALDALIGERQGETDIAIWYGWEGYASLPKWAPRAVYTFMQNTSLMLIDNGLYADFVSGPALGNARVEDGALVINERPYKVVILPFAHALPREVYDTVMAAARQGVRIVFTGPPPAFVVDDRQPASVGEAFQEALGVGPVSFRDFEQEMARRGVSIDPDAAEPPWLDVTSPVQPTTASVTRNNEDEIIVVKAVDAELYWMPSLDPRQDLGNLVEPWCSRRIEVFSRNAYFRLFSRAAAPDDVVLVLAPREGMAGWGLMPESWSQSLTQRPPVKSVDLDVFARIGDRELRVRGGSWCALHVQDGALAGYLADDDISITYAGKAEPAR